MATTHTGTHYQTEWDSIPDFGANPTISSTQAGFWDDPETWNTGQVPGPDDIVLIQHNISIRKSASAQAITILGNLSIQCPEPVRLYVGTLLVAPDGKLQIGSPANPLDWQRRVEIIIRDIPPRDIGQYGTGILCVDGSIHLYGEVPQFPWTRLTKAPQAGDTELHTEQSVADWEDGTLCCLPDSRQWTDQIVRQGKYHYESVVAGKVVDPNILPLATPCLYDHPSAAAPWGGSLLPHVASCQCSVIIESQNPRGNRGHVFLTGRSDIRLQGVLFSQLGRTTLAPLSTTNIKGRYPLHLHHVYGMESAKTAGFPDEVFTVDRCVIDGGIDEHPYKWGIVLHDSHYGRVENNVLYNIAGAAIMTEEGSEYCNKIGQNFICRVTGTGNRMGEGTEATGVWLRGCLNLVSGNVVTNVLPGGPGVQHCGYSLWQQYAGDGKGNVLVPQEPYEAPSMPINLYATPIEEFSDNEVYSSNSAITAWWVGCEFRTPKGTRNNVIDNLLSWNIYSAHWLNYHTHKLVIESWRAAGTPLDVSHNCLFQGGDYFASDWTLLNCTLGGTHTGVIVSTDTGGLQYIEGCDIRTKAAGIVFQTLWTSDATSVHIPKRRTQILNTKLLQQGSGPYAAIKMEYKPTGVANLTQMDEVFVVNHQRVTGVDFDVLYKEQAADFVMPRTILHAGLVTLNASPTPGATNAELWRQNGIALAGRVAPSNARRIPEIDGLVVDGGAPDPQDTEAPTVPLITMALATPTSVELRWNPSTDNSGSVTYLVHRDSIPLGTTADATLTDKEVVPDTEYVYTVTASDPSGNLSDTSSVIVRTPILPRSPKIIMAPTLRHMLADGTIVHASADGPGATRIMDMIGQLLARQ